MNASPPPPEEQPQPEAAQAAPETPPAASGELSKDAKMWGMLCHLSALAGFIGIPFGNILGPLILWLIKKDEMAFVDNQGKEALNFQISIVIYGLVIIPTICFPPLLILLALGIAITNIVFIVMASIAANKGQAYQYPCCIRFIK
ncbi:MAG: DUF4870 domain-containing protein [Phycisphaerae bacterium]|nr:DUF4870 domain-containing protein [Phycisphaerae bacterium]